MPRIRENYDIAIAYSHVSSLKYYIIDKVSAKKKYAFFHHGAYDFDDQTRRFDSEYYPQYDKVLAASAAARNVLLEAIPELDNVSVIPNLIDIESIKENGKEPCPEYPDDQRLKLLTVGRLSPEKNPQQIIKTAKLLDEKKTEFIWLVVGDGELRGTIEHEIKKNQLEGKVILTGNQTNPYRFMNSCDCYLQFSLYEADPITIREVAVFNKIMVLSDIPGFRQCCDVFNNIYLTDSNADTVQMIMQVKNKPIDKNDLDIVNYEIYRTIDQEIFEMAK